jgi:hypothetical protein
MDMPLQWDAALMIHSFRTISGEDSGPAISLIYAVHILLPLGNTRLLEVFCGIMDLLLWMQHVLFHH